MRGFSSPLRKTVTLEHGDDKLTLEVGPLPIAFQARWEQEWPIPMTNLTRGRNTEPVEVAGARDERAAAYLYVCVGLGLHATGEVNTQPPVPGASRKDWQAYVAALRDEFTTAHLADGHVTTLGEAVMKASGFNIGGLAGNS